MSASSQNPFHSTPSIHKLVKPQIGHIASSIHIKATAPAAAPIVINLGLYSSQFRIPYTSGKKYDTYIAYTIRKVNAPSANDRNGSFVCGL